MIDWEMWVHCDVRNCNNRWKAAKRDNPHAGPDQFATKLRDAGWDIEYGEFETAIVPLRPEILRTICPNHAGNPVRRGARVWVFWEQHNRFTGSALVDHDAQADVLMSILGQNPMVSRITAHAYDEDGPNKVGERIRTKNYTALKAERPELDHSLALELADIEDTP